MKIGSNFHILFDDYGRCTNDFNSPKIGDKLGAMYTKLIRNVLEFIFPQILQISNMSVSIERLISRILAAACGIFILLLIMRYDHDDDEDQTSFIAKKYGGTFHWQKRYTFSKERVESGELFFVSLESSEVFLQQRTKMKVKEAIFVGVAMALEK